MQLLTAIANDCPRGVHFVTVEVSSGTAVLAFKTDDTNSTSTDISDILPTVPGEYEVTFPNGTITATLTGDAKMFIDFNVSG